MAGSGESERAVAGSGEGGERPLLRSLDYPCTTRLRLRRLLACIREHGHVDVHLAAEKNMYVIFHVRCLVDMVREGKWRDALYYIRGFAGCNSSYEVWLLVVFLQDLVAFKAFADGQIRVIGYLCRDWLMSIYKKPVLDNYPCFATVVTDVLFMRKDHASAFLDWELVRKKAAKIVKEIAYKAPDLKDRMQYPRSGNTLYHVVPIGSKRRSKHVSRKQSTDLVQFYRQMQKRLPSLSPEADHTNSESTMVRGDQLIALFDRCFEAGRLLELEQLEFPEVLSKEGCPYVLARGWKVVSSKQAKLSSKPDMSQRPAVVDSSVTNSDNNIGAAMDAETGTKRSRCFQQETQQDTVHPGNDPKKRQIVGNSGDDLSSNFKASQLVLINRGTA